MKLKPEVKEAWLEALRSGRYKQGISYLRRNNKHCCLGVLCDLHDPNGWREYAGVDGGDFHMDRAGTPYKQVWVWAIDSDIGSSNITMPGKLQSIVGALVNMNDSGKTFDEIANYIEAEL